MSMFWAGTLSGSRLPYLDREVRRTCRCDGSEVCVKHTLRDAHMTGICATGTADKQCSCRQRCGSEMGERVRHANVVLASILFDDMLHGQMLAVPILGGRDPSIVSHPFTAPPCAGYHATISGW